MGDENCRCRECLLWVENGHYQWARQRSYFRPAPFQKHFRVDSVSALRHHRSGTAWATGETASIV